MTRHSSVQETQHKQIDKLFGGRPAGSTHDIQYMETKRNANCDIHGRRGSGGSVRSLSQRRDSVASSIYASQKEPLNKRDSIGSTILQNHSPQHWNNSFKRDSTPATSVSLHNLAADLRSSIARIDSLNYPDRSSRATTPRVQTIRADSGSFSNGVRRISMPVLNNNSNSNNNNQR